MMKRNISYLAYLFLLLQPLCGADIQNADNHNERYFNIQDANRIIENGHHITSEGNETISSSLKQEDPCSNIQCQNSGTCTVREEDVMCYCPFPYYGDRCEKDPCSDIECKNGGICMISFSSFFCNCTIPFFGRLCEKDPCNPSPCVNNGVCQIDEHVFSCNCPKGFDGTYCEIPCDCENGYCIKDLKGKAHCICPKEYGYITPNKCKACNCGQGAGCTFEQKHSIVNKTCNCPFDKVEENGTCFDFCDTEPCKHGLCINSPSYCICDFDYYGTHCDKKRETGRLHTLLPVVIPVSVIMLSIAIGSVVVYKCIRKRNTTVV